MLRMCLVAAALLAPAAAAAQTAAPPTPAPCAAPERGQFDFWVGRWQVSPTGQDKVVAESRIEKLYGGCAIRENWMPKSNPGGGSLSSYVPADKGWRQTWVGAGGEWVEFTGGWDGKAMVLTGDWPAGDGASRLIRMTYTKAADGSVRQLGEQSDDGGKTWGPSFDFTYRPAA